MRHSRRSTTPTVSLQRNLRMPTLENASPSNHSPRRNVSNDASNQFRNVLRGADVHSKEGQLLVLVRDYSDNISKPYSQKVEAALSQYNRSKFFSEKDINMLEMVMERNQAFMSNVERLLQSAVAESLSMEACVVRSAHNKWSQCNAQNIAIHEYLALASGKSKQHKAIRSKFSSPTSLKDIHLQRSEESKQQHGATKREISSGSAAEMQRRLKSIFGPEEGHIRFLDWLSKMPLESLRELMEDLPQ